MVHNSWNFLKDLDAGEKHILSSAIEMSGWLALARSEDCSTLVQKLSIIAQGEDYLSFLQWCTSDYRQEDVDLLEYNYLNSLFNVIDVDLFNERPNKLKLAFAYLDLKGLEWNNEILNEVYLSVSNLETSQLLYGEDIYYSLFRGAKIQLTAKKSMNPSLLFPFLKVPFVQRFIRRYLKNILSPLVCAIIIIHNEKDFSFSSKLSVFNFIGAFIDGNRETEGKEMAALILNADTRYSFISRSKWDKIKLYEREVEEMLSKRADDEGAIESLDWNYCIEDNFLTNNILAGRRHSFMHAISDGIKGVIAKLKRETERNQKLKECKGQEIIFMSDYVTNWIDTVKEIPLDVQLDEEVINSNMNQIMEKGDELLAKISPFFHSLVDQYAYLFPGYQDNNNAAYRRLKEDFIEKEEILKKRITDFSNRRDYGKIDKVPAIYMIDLILSTLHNVTSHISLSSDYDYSNDMVEMNTDDFQEYVMNNFNSNLKEHAFYRNYNKKNKILVSITMRKGIIAVCISNNGEPFNGDVTEVFEEKYTFGENKGTGQGMFDAKQYMNHIQADIQMKVYPYMEYPVRFALLFPTTNKNNKDENN